MKRFALMLFPLFLACAADAQIYQWKDSNGKTIISDKPPAGQVNQQRRIETGQPPAASATQKSLAERELELRKRRQESQEVAEKSQEDQAAATVKNDRCERAKRNLSALESGERIALRNEKGERYFMEDAQRAREIENAQKIVQENCK